MEVNEMWLLKLYMLMKGLDIQNKADFIQKAEAIDYYNLGDQYRQAAIKKQRVDRLDPHVYTEAGHKVHTWREKY